MRLILIKNFYFKTVEAFHTQGQVALFNPDTRKAHACFGPASDPHALRDAKRFLACHKAFDGVPDDLIEEAGKMIKKLFAEKKT